MAGATDKGFKDGVRRLQGVERQLRNKKKAKGGKPPLSFKEAQALRAQKHAKFSTMTQIEKEALSAELDQMWSKVPEHLREKAKKLAGK